MKNTKADVLRKVFYYLDDNYHPDSQPWLNEKYDKIFKLVVDEFGIEEIADMITDHPNKGYTIRYLDTMAPKMIAELHRKNIEETKEKLKALYD